MSDRSFPPAVAAVAFAAVFAVMPLAGQLPPPAGGQAPAGQGQGFGSGRSGMRGEFPGGGRGVLGTVTEVAADHYTIKADDGSLYTVHFSVNTRIVKGGTGRRGRGQGAGSSQGAAESGERPQPQPLKPSDIKVGDIITAGGEMDQAAKSIGAVFIVQIDPERAKAIREMQANYGKTWLAGRVTGVDGTTIMIEGMVDHAKHSIEVDENTSFRKRRDSITLADIQAGTQVRAEGALQGGVFRATTVTAMEPRSREPGSGAPQP